MSRVVWKYAWPARVVANRVEQAMPDGARFLHVAQQYPDDGSTEITAWFEVDPEAALVAYRFQVFGTGQHDIPSDGSLAYLGTTLHFGGDLVLHLYGAPEVHS